MSLLRGLLFVLWASSAMAADRLTVFAAASLKTALDQIGADWEAQTGHDFVGVYGGSSAMARQIALGAPADVFISASRDWMDWVEAQGAIAPRTRMDVVGNRLVVIARAGTPPLASLDDLPNALGDGRLAVALVESVPAGQYAKAALVTIGLWPRLETRLAQTDNVRSALALVAAGESPLGIVYASDVASSDRVAVVANIPATSHPPIVYAGAATRDADPSMARSFLETLASDRADRVFEANGFELLP